MSKMLARIALVIALGTLSGCATMMGGSKEQQLSFQSIPDNAVVKIDGTTVGITPFKIKLKKTAEDRVAVFQKDGYKSVETTLVTRANGWMWANLLHGYLLGFLVDSSTGAGYRYVRNGHVVTLRPVDQGLSPLGGQPTREFRIKKFILNEYGNILANLKQGSGSYLTSLLKQLEVEEQNYKAATRVIADMSGKYSILEFADQVLIAFPGSAGGL